MKHVAVKFYLLPCNHIVLNVFYILIKYKYDLVRIELF